MPSKDFQERWRISDDVEMVQDLGDAVVCEHGQLVYCRTRWEQRMGIWRRLGIECRP